MNRRYNRKIAFTLIELLIVVAIIAILAAIAVPNFLEAQTRSKVSRVKEDFRSIATALESYAVDHNLHYPPVQNPPGANHLERLIPLTTPVAYLTSIMTDPFNTEIHPAVTPYEWQVPVFWAAPWWDLVSQSTKDIIWAEDPSLATMKPAWFLISYSPDKDFDVNDNGWASTIQYYDPTNGTVSDGDIVRHKQ